MQSALKRARWSAVGFLLALALPGLAAAECWLSVVNVSFGAYDTLSPIDTDIAGNISVSCDVETSGQLTLSAGLGSFAARRMQSGTHSLFYNLYLDPTRLSIWGDGSPGTGLISTGGLGGTYPVYARIPARQSVMVGEYADTITVTLTF